MVEQILTVADQLSNFILPRLFPTLFLHFVSKAHGACGDLTKCIKIADIKAMPEIKQVAAAVFRTSPVFQLHVFVLFFLL